MKNRRSQQAGPATAAAVLIAIIAGLIVLYILFLPPSERERLLEGEDGEDEGEAIIEEEISIILEESPQRLYPVTETEFEQEFPSVLIYVGEEATELKKQSTVYASKSLFSETTDAVVFDVVDLENTKKILMNFEVEKARGRLIITLNGQEVYNAEITTQTIEPIELKDGLKQGANVLGFSVSAPGAAFWRTNEYSLKEILVTADMIAREAQESELTFVIDVEERDNLEKVKLHFYPECDTVKVGSLNIWINNYNLYSAVPDCGSAQKPLEFAPDRLVAGENRLIFSTEKGKYTIDNLRLSSELKEITAPVYYFELNQEQVDQIENEELEAKLYMRFADSTSQKTADILVNNRAVRLDQTEMEFEEVISSDVVKGNNAVKIEPEEVLDVVELKVMLEET